MNAAHHYLRQRTPYRWSSGAKPCGVNGADCACLNRLAYRRGAGNLPHTLHGQRDRGTRTSDPRPGDTTTLGGSHRPICVDVLTPNGY